jgi:hypothetical protein
MCPGDLSLLRNGGFLSSFRELWQHIWRHFMYIYIIIKRIYSWNLREYWLSRFEYFCWVHMTRNTKINSGYVPNSTSEPSWENAAGCMHCTDLFIKKRPHSQIHTSFTSGSKEIFHEYLRGVMEWFFFFLYRYSFICAQIFCVFSCYLNKDKMSFGHKENATHNDE